MSMKSFGVLREAKRHAAFAHEEPVHGAVRRESGVARWLPPHSKFSASTAGH